MEWKNLVLMMNKNISIFVRNKTIMIEQNWFMIVIFDNYNYFSWKTRIKK